MKNSLITSLILSLSLLFACKGEKPKEGYQSIDLKTLKQEVIGKDVQFIDVRTPLEYSNGHIDDAINMNILNRKKFKEQTTQLDPNKPVYLYCMSGGRSYHASKLLQSLGFEIVYDFTGGWSEWLEGISKSK